MTTRAFLFAFAIWFTNPSWGADSLCGEDHLTPQNLASVRLYRALCGEGQPLLLFRERVAVAGEEDSLEVDSLACASYVISHVNVRGLETPLECRPGITVGIPPTAVRNGLGKRKAADWFDLQGRRIRPVRSGRYWGPRDTVVLR